MITGTQDIQQRTVYSDDLIADDALFNVYASATLVLTGDDAFTNTSFALSGQTRNLGASTLDNVDDASFVNIGSVSQTGEVSLGASADDAVVVRNVGHWNLSGDEQIAGFPGDRFVNIGDFVQTGSASVTTISADFIDYGSLDFSGVLDFAGANTLINSAQLSASTIGAIEITAGFARFRFLDAPNPADHNGLFRDLTVSDGAKVSFLDNTALQSPSFIFGALNLNVGATMVIGESTIVVLEDTPVIAGTISGEGEMFLSTEADLQAGARVLVGGSFIRCDVTGRVFLGAPGSDPEMSNVVLNSGTLVTDGLTIWNNMGSDAISGQGEIINWGVSQFYGPNAFAVDGDVNIVNVDELDLGGFQADVSVTLSSDATITNQAGAKLILEAGQSFSLTGGVIVNHGGIVMQSMAEQSAPYATGVIGALVVNDGDIGSGAGLEFQAAVTGTGDDGITPVDYEGSLTGVQGQGLTFDAAVGSGQSILFTGADQLLTLNDIADFQGNVQGFDMFGGADAIVVDASLWSFTGFTENAAGTAGTLGFTDNGAQIGVTLTGDYAASGFQTSVSGSKTTITYG